MAALVAGLAFPAVPAFAADQTVTANTSNTSNTFTPANVTISEGDTVTWNNTNGFHNVHFDDNSFVQPPTPQFAPWTVSRAFPAAGSFRYYCEVHGGPGGVGMSGVVNVSAAYSRPIGASPMRLSLVPAFRPANPATANATHSPPLSGSSSSPPVPRSSLVAVGGSSVAFIRLRVLPAGQCAPFDSTKCYPDFTIAISLTDVRSGSPSGPDYDTANASGPDLTAVATLPGAAQNDAVRITDLYNKLNTGITFDKPATVTPLPLPIPINCTPNADPSTGSTCSAQTTANALFPGAVVAGKRAIWGLGQLQILDQGANGTPGDSDDQVFEVQGVFVP